jgi:hypothetical protein
MTKYSELIHEDHELAFREKEQHRRQGHYPKAPAEQVLRTFDSRR